MLSLGITPIRLWVKEFREYMGAFDEDSIVRSSKKHKGAIGPFCLPIIRAISRQMQPVDLYWHTSATAGFHP